jgi:hypothetical protein
VQREFTQGFSTQGKITGVLFISLEMTEFGRVVADPQECIATISEFSSLFQNFLHSSCVAQGLPRF